MRKRTVSSEKSKLSRRKKFETLDSLPLVSEKPKPYSNKSTIVLPPPTKSENDLRDYRSIKFLNGLTVLLISNTKPLAENEKRKSIGKTSIYSKNLADSFSDDSSMSSDDSNSSENSTASGENSEESLEELYKLEEDCKYEPLASAALCVAVGSFSDPPELPGLAHLLSHVIFMGSSKYPEENNFKTFIDANGGVTNTVTETEKTSFYFDIQQNALFEGLDRLANMVSGPLLNPQCIEKQLKSIENELTHVMLDDIFRKEQLLRLLCKEYHPIHKFHWGNVNSLKESEVAKTFNLQIELSKFHQQYYCPSEMTLAVEAPIPLSKLEAIVSQAFCCISFPCQLTPNNTVLAYGLPFDTTSSGQILKSIPIQKINIVEIIWALPSLKQHYRSKPEIYLSSLIGHEGPGSLLSFLRHKLWALDLSCGNHDSGIYNTSTYYLFQISVHLTEEGYLHIFDVLTGIFQYIKMVIETGPVKRIFDEIKTLEDNIFRWQIHNNDEKYVESLCHYMQIFKPEDYLTGSVILYEYNPMLIRECLAQLTPERAVILFFSKQHENENICNKNELWFQIPYCLCSIGVHWLGTWSEMESNSSYFLPEENKFIATNFSIKTSELPQNFYPVKILDTLQSRLWYKKDFKFLLPKAFVYFQLISPLVNQTPQNSVLFDLFKFILEYNLNEDTFNATVAGLVFRLTSVDTGMVINIHGFNDKLFLLFETIVDHFINFNVSEETFNVLKNRLLTSYHDAFIRPDKLAKELQFALIQQTFWTSVDKRALLTALTKDMVMSFVKHLKSCLFLEGLIQGNVTVEEAMQYEKTLCEKLKCRMLPKAAFPETRILQLPERLNIFQVYNLNKDDNNSVILNYYQYGPGSIYTTCLMSLLVSFMQEPLFDYIKSQHQLCYHIECCCSNIYGIIGFTIMIYIQPNKYNTSYIDEQIERFLDDFEITLKAMRKHEYDEMINTLLYAKLNGYSNLENEVSGNWNEISTQNYIFKRLPIEIQCLKSITLRDLKRFYKKMRQDGKNLKKLSIQIIGNGQPEESAIYEILKNRKNIRKTTITQTDQNMAALTGFLNDLRNSRMKQIAISQKDILDYEIIPLIIKAPPEGAMYIKDIKEFKQQLTMYPIAKLLD